MAFSALVMQFVTVHGGGQRDSEPGASIKLGWPMVVAVVGCGVRRGANEAALWQRTAGNERSGEAVAVPSLQPPCQPREVSVSVFLWYLPRRSVSLAITPTSQGHKWLLGLKCLGCESASLGE